MKKTKVLLTALCALLLVAASVLGTMAYLTDKDEVKNTFTVGQVKIKLDEAKVNEAGNPVKKVITNTEGTAWDWEEVANPADAERVKENDYHLLPGHSYTKDPTLTVLKGSDVSYVRLLVTVTFGKKLTDETLATELDSIFVGYDATEWNRTAKKVEVKTKSVGGTDQEYTVITYEYRYKGTVAAPIADTKLPALFKSINVPSEWTNADMEAIGGFSINVVGQAIQADGFADADAAWAAFPTT